MTGIVLFSHGSLLCGAGGALESHAARLRRDFEFGLVEVGYLNYSEPSFAEAVSRLASAGATEIVIVPFFLAPGYFVTHSLPKCLASVRPSFPDIEFVIAEPLGTDERLADALIESAGGALTSERWREGLAEARAACRANPECPLFGEGCTYPVASNFVLGATPPDAGGVGLAGGRQSSLSKSDVLADGPHPPASSLNSGRGGEGSGGEALLVLVHGSPKAEANDGMYQVVEMVRDRGAFPVVQVGFLECNAPAIPDAIEACVRQGADKIVAVPYFLHMGTHVADDLPALLEEGAARWPNVEFRMGEYIGRSEKLTELLAARANEALGRKKETHYAR